MGVPLKFAMAQVVARWIVENPKEFPELLSYAATFTGEHWRRSWMRDLKTFGHFGQWERSYYWMPIGKRMPEILEKIGLPEETP